MTTEYVTLSLIAEALGRERTTLRDDPRFPAPDMVLRGPGPQPRRGWLRETAEAYAAERGLPIQWPDM